MNYLPLPSEFGRRASRLAPLLHYVKEYFVEFSVTFLIIHATAFLSVDVAITGSLFHHPKYFIKK
jgi:hypothetical protein